jgi:hypothetical protein
MIEVSTRAVPNQLQSPEMVNTQPNYYCDAGDRDPSEISRELRCPDR